MDAMVRGRVWLDVTTTMRAGGNFDGTTRVERSLIRELPVCLHGRVGFCAYNRALKRFSAVPQPAWQGSITPGRSRRHPAGIGATGKTIERALRGVVKNAVGRVAATADRLQRRSAFPEASLGDVLLLAGDRSSLPEAGQGLGIHLDPYDLVSWGREILRLTHDLQARTAMERRILAERCLSSWLDCARTIAAAADGLMERAA